MSSRQPRKTKPLLIRVGDRLSISFDTYTVQSEMSLDAPDALVLGYTRTMMGFLLFKPQPLRIAMIGLGGGSLAKYCYAKLPQASIVVVEIDPEVIALRERFFIPPDDERLQVVCDDGARFLHGLRDQYDVLLVDGYSEFGQAPSLSSQRFYNDCHDCLKPDGIMVINLWNRNLDFSHLLPRIHHSFAGNVLVLDAEDSNNKIVFAGKDAVLQATTEQLLQCVSELDAHRHLKLHRTAQMIQWLRERQGERQAPVAPRND